MSQPLLNLRDLSCGYYHGHRVVQDLDLHLNAGDSDSYPAVAFIGGDYAEVYVEAKVTTDLNIAVYDSKGRLVCSDTDASPIAYCGWRPGSTDSFTMTVRNDGPLGATYALMTN